MITGGAGFVGHHAIEHILKNTDWEIIVLDAITYAGSLNRITDISVYDPKRVRFIYHDLQAPINELIHQKIGKLDYIIHFAAESHVDRSLENALPFAMTNVVGTTNLLEYIKNYQPELKKYIGFNTDEVFGAAPEGIYHNEEYKFKPSNPYAAAKGGQWCMEYAFAHAFSLPIIMVHCMNIIGERQHPEKFVPKTIKSLLNGEKIMLHGTSQNNLSSRCWIHARNVADGLLFLLEKGKPKETYNIAGAEETVYTIANWICQSVKGRDLKEEDIEWIDFHSARPGHDKRYALDNKKITELGWIPPITLRKSIKKTVKWSLKHRNWLNI
jgi:dTDP-glucose 4,6-dehydratase